MKKSFVIGMSALLLLGSCDTYTGAGAYMGTTLGSIFGSAIGGIAGGPHGSDVGTVVGMIRGPCRPTVSSRPRALSSL